MSFFILRLIEIQNSEEVQPYFPVEYIQKYISHKTSNTQ